jgi:hypothetical protein
MVVLFIYYYYLVVIIIPPKIFKLNENFYLTLTGSTVIYEHHTGQIGLVKLCVELDSVMKE